MIVLPPLVVTVGEPVVMPEYFDVGTLSITTPVPPAPPHALYRQQPTQKTE